MSESAGPSGVASLPSAALTALARGAMHDRAVGTLIGSAVGDAVGLYTEFLRRDRIAAEYPSGKFALLPTPTPFARDFHRLKHRPGEWTDDTDHALLIVLSFLHNGKLDARDVAERLHVWVRMGLRALDTPPLGLGATVGSIVRSPSYLEDPIRAAHAHWAKTKYNAAPNGSLMRTHPLGVLCVFRSLEETFTAAAQLSAITHVDPRAVVACMLGTGLVRGLIRGEMTEPRHIDEMVAAAIADYKQRVRPMFESEGPFAPDDPGLDEAEFLKHANAKTLDELDLDGDGIGYVLKCLGSGLVLLRTAMAYTSTADSLESRTTAFEPLMTHLVLQGGDADTNACFAGALLGAYLGYTSLPRWREGLLHGAWLLAKAEAVATVLGLRVGSYDAAADKDTRPDGGRGFLTDDQVERKFMELQARIAGENTEFMRAEEEAARKRSKSDTLWRLLNWN